MYNILYIIYIIIVFEICSADLRQASDVVVFLEDSKTLAHLRRARAGLEVYSVGLHKRLVN